MKIAIIGIRGIPVSYSTFETFAETLSTELVKRGHIVSVYCRKKYVTEKSVYKGVDRIILPSIETKHLSTFSHSLISTLHAIFLREYDVILYLSVGNSIFSILPRLFGIKTIVHIDGLDWERKKWGTFAQAYLKFSLFLTTFFTNRVISDNVFMVDYYKKKYNKRIDCIPYGYFPLKIEANSKVLKKYKLISKKYFVWVGRIVPENNLEELLYAFKSVTSNMNCVVIGDDLFDSEYKTKMYKLIKLDKRITHTGFIKHEDVLSLVGNARTYIETKRNGGTQMALIEAMGTGVPIIANDNKAHKNILGNSAFYYNPKAGSNILTKMLNTYSSYKSNNLTLLGREAQKRAEKKFRWSKVIDLYEKLFRMI